MREFLRLLLAPCSEISRQNSRGLDGKLPWSHRLAIRIHHLYCKACRRYARQIRFLRDAISKLDQDILPEEFPADTALPPEARQRIKRALQK